MNIMGFGALGTWNEGNVDQMNEEDLEGKFSSISEH